MDLENIIELNLKQKKKLKKLQNKLSKAYIKSQKDFAKFIKKLQKAGYSEETINFLYG